MIIIIKLFAICIWMSLYVNICLGDELAGLLIWFCAEKLWKMREWSAAGEGH